MEQYLLAKINNPFEDTYYDQYDPNLLKQEAR